MPATVIIPAIPASAQNVGGGRWILRYWGRGVLVEINGIWHQLPAKYGYKKRKIIDSKILDGVALSGSVLHVVMASLMEIDSIDIMIVASVDVATRRYCYDINDHATFMTLGFSVEQDIVASDDLAWYCGRGVAKHSEKIGTTVFARDYVKGSLVVDEGWYFHVGDSKSNNKPDVVTVTLQGSRLDYDYENYLVEGKSIRVYCPADAELEVLRRE